VHGASFSRTRITARVSRQRMAEPEQTLFRPARPSRLVALFGGSRGTAAWPSSPTWPTRPTSASSTGAASVTARAPARTAPHPLDVLGELREFAAVELPISINVEAHGVFDKPLG